MILLIRKLTLFFKQNNAQLGVSLINCSNTAGYVCYYTALMPSSHLLDPMTKVGLCCAVACFHSDSGNGSSVRIECQIEGSTSPGNSKNVMESINEIVTKKYFYIPGTNVSSGRSY